MITFFSEGSTFSLSDTALKSALSSSSKKRTSYHGATVGKLLSYNITTLVSSIFIVALCRTWLCKYRWMDKKLRKFKENVKTILHWGLIRC